MRLRTIMVLLLALSEPSMAEQPPAGGNQAPTLTVDNINRQSEILRNPGLAVDNARQVLSVQAQTPSAATPPAPATLSGNERRISDPTQMTGSFSQALNRISAKPGASGDAPAAPPALPDISLAAKAICHHNNKAALLNVAGKTHMIKQGGKFSFLSNNIVYEIQVNKIEKEFVDIIVLPMGRTMILQ